LLFLNSSQYLVAFQAVLQRIRSQKIQLQTYIKIAGNTTHELRNEDRGGRNNPGFYCQGNLSWQTGISIALPAGV
jgi:hypothetical protein